LSGVLDIARKHGCIRFNPVRDVERVPATSEREPVILTLAEIWSLIEHAPDPHTACLILVAAFTGARQSEVFALRWESVGLTEAQETLTIREEYYRGELVKATKTAAGMRVVPLAPQVAEALRAQYVRLKVDGRPNPHDLVFPAVKGGYWAASYFTSGPWTTAREAAGLTYLDFHDLRRFYISHIRSQKLASAVTKQLVGHSDERTHASYTHPIPGTEGQIREALSNAFQRPPGSTVVAREALDG
jgi:integrase